MSTSELREGGREGGRKEGRADGVAGKREKKLMNKNRKGLD